MVFKIKYHIISVVILCAFFSNVYSQKIEPWRNGETVLNDKIKKYKSIDSLDYNDPINALYKSKNLYFEVSLTEGVINLKNIEKKIFGSGGFSTYKFIDKNSKKTLKTEYNITEHFYEDEKKNIIKTLKLRR
ncbi:hypothetical protein SAMN05421847_0284 [Halpernia humi]|uniref:Uncharacterized protein n=1 Tax=Halpernia humi TaxID=493375 RepID=A0A1H5SXQ1_9FLAO|nr:hypothetical protein [Halpernia humi]SEF54718.1 hypothetical protein SAMN05421847_0284 [Halpernia humi]